ncbi:MAG TPA: FdtA/QdtA family cupin domain-containing protein [Patescibacteria group bacterium]|nr:FdtA/QdtA family cupin domain-containing protein [Patescibacteria group bacterium]
MRDFLRNVVKILVLIGKPFYLLAVFFFENILNLKSDPIISEIDKGKLVKLITAPLMSTDGSLCQLQSPDVPFDIKRVYYIFGVSVGAVRGAHTHKETIQVLFCIQGSIIIVLDDGKKKEKVLLNKSNIGVLLEPGVWHEMQGFKKDTILLVLASERHDPQDYVRSYDDFLKSYGEQ